MARPISPDITRLLVRWSNGDSDAEEQLIPLVSGELRRLAHAYMRRQRPGHLLQTTALVHEAYMRLVDARTLDWQSRAHFYGISAKLMREILVEFARAGHAQKRGGGAIPVPLENAELAAKTPGVDLVALDDALNDLAQFDQRKAKIVELRFFGGLSVQETAEALGVCVDTVMRDWRFAKTWLSREMRKAAEDPR